MDCTIISFRRSVPALELGCDGPFAVDIVAVAAVSQAAVVKAGLRVLLQFLGQVGAWRAGGHVVLAAVLRDLQRFHNAHRPGK